MLIESGDLIPVLPEAVDIPWTKRKSEVINFLHRGRVTFRTYVYDTNVGDIAPLSTYFNPRKWTVKDLNNKFGQCVDNLIDQKASFSSIPSSSGDSKCVSLQPKLLIYPEIFKSDKANGNYKPTLKKMSPSRIWSIPPPLVSTPKTASQLPSPPLKTSPPQGNNEDDNPDPIAPPKRRRMSLNDAFNYSSYSRSLLDLSSYGISRSLSPFTPFLDGQFSFPDLHSPLLCLESTKVWALQEESDLKVKTDTINNNKAPIDTVCIQNDQESLARNLRKIAEPENW